MSFMSRGYLKLHHLALNNTLNTVIIENLKERLESRQGENLGIFGIQGLMLYMSFLNNNESKRLMADYLLPLLHKEEVIQELDTLSLSEIFQSLASIIGTHSKEIGEYLEAITPQIIKISKQLQTDTISDLMIVASACNYSNQSLFQDLKQRTFFNFREEKPCSEISISKILCSFAQYDVVKSLQKHVDLTESQNTSLTDNLILFSYFPTLVFHQQSPQYIFYNRLSKEINKVKEKLSQKWIAMSIFGIASAQYNNFEFIDECVQQILRHQSDEGEKEQGQSNYNINELTMLLFGYSNTKRSNEWSRKMIEQIRDMYMQNKFNKATSIAWSQFFNTLVNTNQENELDEIEQQFAEIVYFDKIQPSLNFITQNMVLSFIFSFSRLDVDQDILIELLSYVQIDRLSNFQLYLLNISLQLSTLQNNQNIPQISSSASPRLKEVELYMKNIIAEKQDFYGNQRFSYKQIIVQVKQILHEIVNYDNSIKDKEQIIENYFDEQMNIMIDFYLPESKRALFIYTYDNCLMQEFTDQKTVSDNNLSGLFQAKERILKNNQITVFRIYAQEFNQIGLKTSIEQEKLLKKQFVKQLLEKID